MGPIPGCSNRTGLHLHRKQTSDLGGHYIRDRTSCSSRHILSKRVKDLVVAGEGPVMTAGDANQLISVQPNDLKFLFELDKPSFCDLQLTNNTDSHVAFKVKTTSPKKYFVRPNTGIVMPSDSCIIRVTLQAQREYPPDMQCKDKFLLQSTIVPPNTDVDDLPANTFNKDGSKEIKERKLKTIQHLKDERDATVRQTVQLQQELDFLKRQRKRRNNSSFSFVFASFVGLIGLMVGFLLNLSLASLSTE
ncbi:hypothetical protein V6N13_133856 [Hibiscus sabdariffa]|uniref:MSP domain-containing protein n=1 Tax=Hibiscus sabdariffa TaxID=183260 RepID=A0ABR2R0K2_9ROSI